MYEPLRVFERHGPQQQSVDDAEHRGVRADAQAERDNGYNSESALLQQHSRAVAQVLLQGLQKSSTPTLPQSHTKKYTSHSASSSTCRRRRGGSFMSIGARPSDLPWSPDAPGSRTPATLRQSATTPRPRKATARSG